MLQSIVTEGNAAAVPGDYASTNPRDFVLAGPGGLVAGAGGLRVGSFAWVDGLNDTNGSPTVASNTGADLPDGVVIRSQSAVIGDYLSPASLIIPEGLPVTLMSDGDVWVQSSNGAKVGYRAFANLADGSIEFGPFNAGLTGWIMTNWIAKSAGEPGDLIKMSMRGLA